MRVLSLFSGIGGIDLGLERAGHTVVAQSEVDPYCCRVLAKHWPDVPNLGDVTLIDWNEHLALDIELIAGGYPCQPFSLASAGRRKGTKDVRHLWPFMLDAIRVLRPRVALLENVPGHLSLGFDRVLGDLAESGYDAEWNSVSAASVSAPHRRDRVIVVAYPNQGSERDMPFDAKVAGASSTDGRPMAYANGEGSQGHRAERQLGESERTPRATGSGQHAAPNVADTEGITVGPRLREDEPTEIGWRRPSDLDSAYTTWTVEPDVGRVAHGVPYRVDRLRALGNAVVPQVAEFVGRLIAETFEVAA